MTTTKKLFGAQRLILDDMGYTDSFVVPAGHCITRVLAETKDEMLTGGSLSIGSANSGVETASFSVASLTANVYEQQQFTVTATEGEKETATLTVTNGAVAGGEITVAGAAVVTTVDDDSAAEVAAKIVTAVNLGATWTATQGLNADTDKVYLEAKAVGTIADPTWTDSAPVSGVAITVTVTNQGVAAPLGGTVTIAGKQIILQASDVVDTATAVSSLVFGFGGADPNWELAAANNTMTLLAKTYGDKQLQTIVVNNGLTGISFSAVTEHVKGSAAPTAGDITVAGETVTLIEADVATLAKVATKIAAHSFSDWTVERVGAGLTLTALGEGAINDVTVALDTATGITFSAVTTVGSVAHAEIAQATTLSNDATGMVELTLVSNGNYALASANKTAHINLSFGELVDNVKLYVSMEKYI